MKNIVKNIKKHIPFRIKRTLLKFYPQKPLWKKVPLLYPLAIHIDPCNICNFKCVFCPTGNKDLLVKYKREPCMMSMELFKKVIDDFSILFKNTDSKLYHINMYKDGEPLLNPNICDMISYAKNAHISNSISITTNGSLITKKLAADLIKSKIDLIRISIEHVSSDGYKKISNTSIRYEDIIDKVKMLYMINRESGSPVYILVKITDSGLNTQELTKFKYDFSKICDEVRVDHLMGWSNSNDIDFTLGIKPKTNMDGSTIIHNQIVCPDPFSRLAINSNGTVSACCVDWSHGVLTGDVNKNSIAEIWNGEEYRHLRRMHLLGQRDAFAACSNCQFVQGTHRSENLDPYREGLLSHFF